jgi:hypothetical protein
MRPSDNEPLQEELETLTDEQERALLEDPELPEDVKSEIEERLERFADEDLESEIAEGAPL